MKAISIRQPWAWVIVNGYKDIENRSWPTKHRGQILIHAGKTFDHDGEFGIVLSRPDIVLPDEPEDYGLGGIVGVAEITDCVRKSDSPWFVGEYGFVMRNAKPWPLMPILGERGLFDVPIEAAMTIVCA